MAKKKEKSATDAPTEEKIKNAARVVFQKKGYAATRTRDIAEEAGINLALLNYYFRSKERLFEIIMMQTLSDFLQTLLTVMNDESTTFEEKNELFVSKYIDSISKEPYIPLFVLNEMQNRPENFLQNVTSKDIFIDSLYSRQFQQAVAAGRISEPDLVNFIINLMGLVIMPFISMPVVRAVTGMDDAQFGKLLQARKKMIPIWIKRMMFAG